MPASVAGTAPAQTESHVAEQGVVVWRLAFADAAGIFAEGYIPDVVQPVLDVPMRADQVRQALRRCVAAWKAGDVVFDFAAVLGGESPLTRDSDDLPQARPVGQARQVGAGLDQAHFQTAVAFVDCGGRAPQISRPLRSRLRGGKAPRRRLAAARAAWVGSP